MYQISMTRLKSKLQLLQLLLLIVKSLKQFFVDQRKKILFILKHMLLT